MGMGDGWDMDQTVFMREPIPEGTGERKQGALGPVFQAEHFLGGVRRASFLREKSVVEMWHGEAFLTTAIQIHSGRARSRPPSPSPWGVFLFFMCSSFFSEGTPQRSLVQVVRGFRPPPPPRATFCAVGGWAAPP